MIKTITLVFELLLLIAVFYMGNRFWWHRYSGLKKGIVFILLGCATLTAISVGMATQGPTRLVTLTALNEKNENAKEASVYLEKIRVDGVDIGLPQLESGQWTIYNDRYCWFEVSDERRAEGQSDTVSFQLKVSDTAQIVFYENSWRGKVLIQIDNTQEVVDTYWNGGDKGRSVTITLPAPKAAAIIQRLVFVLLRYLLALIFLCVAVTALLEMASKIMSTNSIKKLHGGSFKKLAGYQFLFEELVKRDFKKKYKRTVLGMAWSMLSPLLTLLVMRMVFTQFFGNHVLHYTTYLFCGNLVFSYFNESTSQGMTSLTGNASIFTKVNVPKYLFLFSKNVQTLINFGLTLCVFFVFAIMDNITFTWKFIFLLYPICCLVLFNIGVGLILSALFVFFRDIQYLWSVFTMLLMYMSAIFYTIDNYSYTVQCLFLVNPVYLFIRYFRKIVIEATIPTIWFHLLALMDVVIVLAIGCWMYKKYNHRFLYYV